VRRLFDGKFCRPASTLEPGWPAALDRGLDQKRRRDIVFALPRTAARRPTIRDPRASVVIIGAANPYRKRGCRASPTSGTTLMCTPRRGAVALRSTRAAYPGFAGPNPQWVTARITADKGLPQAGRTHEPTAAGDAEVAHSQQSAGQLRTGARRSASGVGGGGTSQNDSPVMPARRCGYLAAPGQ
jgi:hypothetical protein